MPGRGKNPGKREKAHPERKTLAFGPPLLEAKHDSKKFHEIPAQECSKVPKICSYFSGTFLTVSDQFKLTVVRICTVR